MPAAPESPVSENPGVQLGLLLGSAARAGRDKATLVTSTGLDGFGAWIEQLLAESTGKDGRGIIPVDGERLEGPAVYGDDRVFVATTLNDEPDERREEALDGLARAGHPVVRIRVRDRYDIGAECFRWELATAVAGAVLGVHPFDQPDVEASKVATRAITSRESAGGRAAPPRPVAELASDAGVISAYAARPYSTALRRSAGAEAPLQQWVTAHMRRLRPRGYFAVLAYLEMCEPYRRILDDLRHQVRAATRVATTVGFGPRFLHSTGQAHKGGPGDGLFLIFTCTHVVDVPVPHQDLTFGGIEEAQAAGDCTVLAARGRRWLRLHLDGDVGTGLATAASLVSDALAAGARARRRPARR